MLDVKPSADYVRSILSYDANSGVFTWKVATGRHGRFPVGSVAGWVNGGRTPSRYVRLKGKQYPMSHVAWVITHGAWPELFIDHINGDSADNKLSNLRLATNAQNSRNKHYSWGASGLKGARQVKGVSKKGANRWRAVIRFDYSTVHIGYFNTKEEAHSAYCKKAEELFGEFAHP